MINKKYNFVFFWDIGNVLIKFTEKEFQKELLKNRLPYFSEEKFVCKYNEIISESFLGKSSLDMTWSKLFDILNLKDDQFESIKKKYEMIKNQELMNFIKKKLNSYDIGFISDLHQIAYYFMQERCGEFFDNYPEELKFLSNQRGFSKEFHGHDYLNSIFNVTKIDKKSIVYIDDETANTDIVKRLGVNTILFDGFKDGSWEGANKKIFNEIERIIKCDS